MPGHQRGASPARDAQAVLLQSAADEMGMEILKIGDIVPCGGCNTGGISVVVLLCLKKCATLLGIRSYVYGLSLCV